MFSAALITTSTGSRRLSEGLSLLVGSGGLLGSLGSKGILWMCGEEATSSLPWGIILREGSVWEARQERVVGGWGGRKLPPQSTGSCQHPASPRSACAKDQGGPATDLAVSASGPPSHDVGQEDSAAPRELVGPLSPVTAAGQSASTAF